VSNRTSKCALTREPRLVDLLLRPKSDVVGRPDAAHAFLTTQFSAFSPFSIRSDLSIDPLKYVDLPENLQERDKYYLYSEMILKLQMARDHLLRQQSEKSVSRL
jgi:hypothetical protein